MEDNNQNNRDLLPPKPIDVQVVEGKGKKGWEIARNVLTCITAVMAAVSLWYADKNFSNALNSGEKNKEYVTTINTGIKDVNIALKDLHTTIQGINSSIASLQSRLDTSMSTFQHQFGEFGKTADQFNSTFAQMNEALDTQLVLMRTTQKQWETELSRKPNLELGISKVQRKMDTLDVMPAITNVGNKVATYFSILLEVPVEYKFIPKYDINGTWASDNYRHGNIVAWSFYYEGNITPQSASNIIVEILTPGLIPFRLVLPKGCNSKYVILNYNLGHEFFQHGTISIPTRDYVVPYDTSEMHQP